MNIKLYAVLFGICIINAACHQYNDELKQALELSGDNRVELEKVLSHYSAEQKDSLHLKAAIFLIENMPGHYTLDNEFLFKYRQSMDSLYPHMSKVIKDVIYTIPQHDDMFKGNVHKVEDLKIMRADYLIHHIDNAINMWQSCPWLQSVSFQDFCEYLLPYRLGDEPLSEIDSTQYLWKQVYRDMNYYNYTPLLLEDVKSFQRNIIGTNDNVYFQNLQTPLLKSPIYTLECLDMCFYDVIGFRYSGIPSTIDFIPNWSSRNGRHYWRTIIDPSCLQDNFSETLNPRTGKVYRMTYSHNLIPISNGVDSIPELFQNPFYKDVTGKYLKTAEITVRCDAQLSYNPEYLYLAIFNDLEWKPITWAKNKGGKAIFESIGRNIVYLPLYYKGKQELCAGYPFKVDLKGNLINLIPDQKHTIILNINRKYPLTYSKIHWTKSLNGCYIEASNNVDFSHSDTMGVINIPNASLNWTSFPIETDKSYRYWRISKKDRPIGLAEVEFYDKLGKELFGEPLSSGKGNFNKNAFDKDKLTFCNYNSWLGVDFKNKVSLKSFCYLPRTDGNGIISGNIYELYYFDMSGWVSLGKQRANGQNIIFDNVPSGALYWLRNLTKGREERIFTYENGCIVFW